VEGLRAALEAAHNRSELQQQRIEALSAEVAAAHAQLSEAQEEAVHLAAALAVAQSDSQDLAATRDDLQRQVEEMRQF
jgi:chromosome segregation ATPase